jgi:asparagine synthase (glutamine-hydrolysing)
VDGPFSGPDAGLRPKLLRPQPGPDAASFFADGIPEWFAETTSERAVREAGVFRPELVAGLLAKCARTGGQNMGNTDGMRTLAVVSTQLTHASFIAGDGWTSSGPALPALLVAVDLVADGNDGNGKDDVGNVDRNVDRDLNTDEREFS